MIAIAIDGPSGAGKSSIARSLAGQMGYVYIDTGALYRAIGLYALEHGVEPTDREKVPALLPQITLELRHRQDGQHVYLNGRDVSEEIRTPAVSMAASGVSAIPEVRAFLLELQQGIAAKQNVIMDGRDIGTVVLPGAQVKIFLTASSEERARRRYQELLAKGKDVAYEQVLADVIERDRNDSTRAIAPLRPAPDAVTVDTTGNDFEQSVSQLRSVIEEKLAAL
ncbi:MAG: (d)CMP kinase [Clostridiales bacterium]|uniref:Cytidylate kinase n=1 Tax=Harryflintia acetispora TaxID=1849041 RepID=A0A9X8Y8D4_9FIRM|nr:MULTISPECIES: (d)CMP kinase [Oscillospiraceae]PWM34475.1 MAG: (d)CMP kinase [Clostridiales bacterium]RGB68370.1 (d)CMP kinase [Harryflintia acetispora]TCL43695.1 cytidylate kinase [Harryflintia acetispora]